MVHCSPSQLLTNYSQLPCSLLLYKVPYVPLYEKCNLTIVSYCSFSKVTAATLPHFSLQYLPTFSIPSIISQRRRMSNLSTSFYSIHLLNKIKPNRTEPTRPKKPQLDRPSQHKRTESPLNITQPSPFFSRDHQLLFEGVFY